MGEGGEGEEKCTDLEARGGGGVEEGGGEDVLGGVGVKSEVRDERWAWRRGREVVIDLWGVSLSAVHTHL